MDEQRIFLLYLAKTAKELYRECLTFRAAAELLREHGIQELDDLVEDAGQSKEIEEACALFDRAIDTRLPPSDAEIQETALLKLIQELGLNRGTIH